MIKSNLLHALDSYRHVVKWKIVFCACGDVTERCVYMDEERNHIFVGISDHMGHLVVVVACS